MNDARRMEPAHLIPQPPVVDLAQELLGVRGKLGRVPQRLGLDAFGQLRRPGVRVDDAVHMPAEPQPELQIAPGDPLRHPESL